jgi:hypothetical protein
MNSEEMRTDLESFVNQGLMQGWLGWPVKGRQVDEHTHPFDGVAERHPGESTHFAAGLLGRGMSLS